MREVLEHLIHQIASFWVVKTFIMFILALFGAWTIGHQVLALLFIADLISGVWLAARKHSLSSAISRGKGVPKLVAYSVLLFVTHQVDLAIADAGWGQSFQGLGVDLSNFTLMDAAIMFLALTEAMSILENVSLITGVRLKLFNNPKKLLEEAQQGAASARAGLEQAKAGLEVTTAKLEAVSAAVQQDAPLEK